ncbi:sugar ABC transporter substrate-binding protein [Trinickia terrae]|uniref:Sugar ABC transporter substrate-binding protein n=2 Tax=Trinickia terrae TaxID=2571161 RepID=A0A4U1HJX0_9BURK|nr:sugar ABC transporter substrate-binding protein [Trinickia terrae]
MLPGYAQVPSVTPAMASNQTAPAQPPSAADMRSIVVKASEHSLRWSGPQSGPPAYPKATIAILSEDLRNGGVLGVAQGIQEAARVIGWKTRIFDSGGTAAGRHDAVHSALAIKPDGVIILGADAEELRAPLKPFADAAIPIVGWHVGPNAGPMHGGPVAVNVSTDTLEVARVTAMAAVTESGGRANVVVFTDNHYEIAKAKANAMAEVIRACKSCRLLEVRDVSLSNSPALMPAVTKDLLAKYGKDWNYALAINDIYFDYAAPELTKTGRASGSISMLSAGDGSAAAFLRIRARTFQTGTVAEPLNMQGWQLIDELNRLLSHQPVTGYIAPVHLVTTENIAFDGGLRGQFDPDNGYRNIYRSIWRR